MASQQF